MTPERWQQIRSVLDQVLEAAPTQRPSVLARACSADLSLRQEVEILLASSDAVRSSFLQSSSLTATLGEGTSVGEYEIKSLLGSGGMGEVYRARDSRLGRDVAIKVLPRRFSADPDRLRRFEQEARAAAALNHPNILAVFQMGSYEGATYLVSELLEGETLRQVLRRGRLSTHLAIQYGAQISEGLAAAHKRGIVHRDIKPENLFVTHDGRVKILDFGLAKLAQPLPGSGSGAPKGDPETEPGLVMGTVGYMSPEQVRGELVDPRTDIFSFGAILYEILSARRAFQKPTSPETMTAILNEEPPAISQVASDISPALQRVVHRCLEKNPDRRFQSASDLAFALEALSRELGYESREPERGSRSSTTLVIKPRPAASLPHLNLWKMAAAVLLATLLAGIALYYHRRRQLGHLSEADTIILADFANSTGDSVFDDTLKAALNVSLRQSPFLNVVPEGKASKILRQMAIPAGTRLTPDIAQRLCQRAGSKAYIAGAIGSLGSEYVLELKAMNCLNGDTLAREQETAASKEKVLHALGQAASRLRSQLGESLATVQRFDVPLEQATTSSLEALKELDLGRKAVSSQGVAAALLHDQRAIQLDPNFAMGYSAVGVDYSNLGELERANQYISKAFQLRDRSSEREKLAIAARYYADVTGELDEGAQSFLEEIAAFPREAAAYVNLGIVYAEQGQYDKAAEVTRQALQLTPDNVGTHENLANYLLALQRFDQARQLLHQMQARKMDDVAMHNALYALAFLGEDPAAMADQQRWFEGQPRFTNWGLSLASDTEAYHGHLHKARELTKRAVQSALGADSRENAAVFQAIAAQRDAANGSAALARQEAAQALTLEHASYGAESEAALAFAMAGDMTRAQSLAGDLRKRFPLNTQMQSVWLPALETRLMLGQKKPSFASDGSQGISPIALGQIGFVLNLSCMYPIYLRGEAYLAARQPTAAAADFQSILDHSGIVWNCWTGALAHLGVARANAMQAGTSQGADADAARVRALAAYNDFLTLWKDADPDIPILRQAKAEYEKLQ